MDLDQEYRHAVAEGHVKDNLITLHDGSKAKISKKENEDMELIIKKDGGKYVTGDVVDNHELAAK